MCKNPIYAAEDEHVTEDGNAISGDHLAGEEVAEHLLNAPNERVTNYCRAYHDHPDGGSCTD